MSLDAIGAVLHPAFFDGGEVTDLLSALAGSDRGRAGDRLQTARQLRHWVGVESRLGAMLAAKQGTQMRPVRAILFDKSCATNWVLGWHQDRTIAVRAHAEVSGFENWTVKSGVVHAEPPFSIIERMVTVRIHLDDVPADNGPLRVILGSHSLGRLEEQQLVELDPEPQLTCLASAGDVWLYRTSIVHASDRSAPGHRRRVLQVDFSSDQLPYPLEWALEI